MGIRFAVSACLALWGFSASAAPAQDSSGDLATVTLLTKDTRVAADGTWVQTIHVEMRANNEATAMQLGKAAIPYDVTTQTTEVTDAHTQKADGKAIPVEASAIYDQIPAGQGDVTSRRSKVIVFPQFATGDTQVYTVKLSTKQPYFPGQFMDVEIFPQTLAYSNVRETLTAPKSMALNVESHDVEFNKKDSGNDIVYSWHYSANASSPDIPALSPLDSVPRFFVSSFKDYAELGKAYAAGADSKRAVTPKVSALADQLTRGITDRKMQVQQLYEWVSGHIRYVAIELGTGSFVPHDVDSIIVNGYGDCKDHDVLLQALLKAKRIDAQSILINSSNSYTLADTATFGTLDHVITFVPEFDLYLDSTATVAPFGVLLISEYGKPMVVAAANGSGRAKMPLLAPGIAKIITKTNGTVDKNGVLSGTTVTTATGPYVIALRAFGLGIQAAGPQAAVNLLTSLGYKDPEGSFIQDSPMALTPNHTITGTFKASGWSDALSGNSSFLLPGGLRIFGVSGDGIMGPFYPGKAKLSDPVLCFSAEASEDLSLTAPPDAIFGEVPKDVRIETPNLLFVAHWSLAGNTMSVHRDFTSHVDQQICTGRMAEETADAIKAIVNSYDNTNLYFKKKDTVPAAPDAATTPFDIGLAHYKAGQYDLAVAEFGEEIGQRPDEPGSYENRGLAYMQLRQFDKAIADFDKAIALKPDEAIFYYFRGQTREYLRQWDISAQDATKAINLNSDDARYFKLRGQDFGNIRQYDRAISDYSQAIKLAPDDSGAFQGRGFCYLQDKQYSSAIADEDQALKLKPNSPDAFYLRGSAYLGANNFANAIKDFSSDISLRPGDTQALLLRAKAEELSGQKAESDKDVERAVKLDPTLAGPPKK